MSSFKHHRYRGFRIVLWKRHPPEGYAKCVVNGQHGEFLAGFETLHEAKKYIDSLHD